MSALGQKRRAARRPRADPLLAKHLLALSGLGHREVNLPLHGLEPLYVGEKPKPAAIDKDLAPEAIPHVFQDEDAIVGAGLAAVVLGLVANVPGHDPGYFGKPKLDAAR